ncbi:NAD-dependent epimerase/dehydratase family protein [Qipengyuania sp. YG27]|uniref:NAD-dependent epimerase/dehydratase family protein n=1 Tax=Qipengyuania mesophila TaxID=2867246 RepID=A0ABS7JQX0_9SPHN|nr:NAD-dependent epimerase/dehydratase family protein [Qipengyuania mesophila]MBX7500027.1 NAD-dependent epimerase/dehydratase family protein [Qipengyuania mesophila]
MRLLIIGGTGFIGRHFVRAARARGYEVGIASRSARPDDDNLGTCDWVEGGIETLCEVPRILAEYDWVCHLASTVVPASSNADPERDVRENLALFVRFLEAMRGQGADRLLYLSTGGALYGPPDYSPINEDHPKRPVSSYGIVKVAAEMYLRMYREAYGLQPAIVRPSNPYGPGQTSIGQLGAVNTFLSLARDGREATIYGDGSIVRDFVHVDDLCAMLLAIVGRRASGTYNCGSGSGTSLNDLIAVVEEITGKPLARRHMPARSVDPASVVLDITRARKDLGWAPEIALRDGVRQCWGSISAREG